MLTYNNEQTSRQLQLQFSKSVTEKQHIYIYYTYTGTVKTAMGDLCGRRPPAIPDRLLRARMCFQR
jgi:hypothetical protein